MARKKRPKAGTKTTKKRKKASPKARNKARKAVRKTSAKKANKKAKPAAKKSVKKAAKKTVAKTGRGKMIVVSGPMRARYSEIISPAALEFLAGLHRKFDKRRLELMQRRADRQRRFDAGELPDFLAETKKIREQGWKIGPVPKDLQDRRVEITGPVDRKMVVNALNSGAQVYMADFEDACSPSWDNLIEGQLNLKDRWAGKLAFTDPKSKKQYKLNDKVATLIVRPRGWHLTEDHVVIDGEPISGSLFDFGLYFFHNAKRLVGADTGPYFYIAKIESHLEARLWNDVFEYAQQQFKLPTGTIKATVLIETLPAAFEMDEILYEMRDHILGLNAGRWDYIFSFIKRLGKNKRFLTPDRSVMTMDKAFLSAYAQLLIRTCHRRGAYAMGGMAAQIPVKGDDKANNEAFKKVRADKEREAGSGNDGTWVAHPGLVPVAEEVFNRMMPKSNQLDVLREDVKASRDKLLEVHDGDRTEEGLRLNIRVGIQYIEAWIEGRGAVPLYNLMEDAATAEISRMQVWQWIYHGAKLKDGRTVTADLFEEVLEDEMKKLREVLGPTNYDAGHFDEAIQIFKDMSLSMDVEEFLTIPAYELVK
ncbi:MAG TPA: malate synthase A [Xanthobacteraceae bacterium]|nr:malate synthase A [Xanthobacteraceae bacterium]